jgi:hypothetical protein
VVPAQHLGEPALGLAPGYAAEQADAEQAYVQARLGGDAQAWVRIPLERQPAACVLKA